MNAGKEGSALARSTAVLSDAMQQAVLPLQPQSVQDFGNGAQSGAAVLARTQNAVSSVLGLRTPLLHQGDMTGFFLSYIFCAICGCSCFLFEESIFIAYYRVSCYIFFSVSAGQHSKSRPCLLGLRGMYYRLCAVVCFIIFLLSLYFLLALPLCSRIVWDYLCRGGLRAG